MKTFQKIKSSQFAKKNPIKNNFYTIYSLRFCFLYISFILFLFFSLSPSSIAKKHLRNQNRKESLKAHKQDQKAEKPAQFANQFNEKQNSNKTILESSIQSDNSSVNLNSQNKNQAEKENINKCFLNNPPIRANYGVWINLWNYPKNPEKYFEELRENGINTIYLQISRSTTEAIKHPEAVNQIIKSAKEKNIKVIGWMYATLENPREDAEKFVLGAQIPGLHSMAIDLEENLEPSRLILFSRTAHKELGRQYKITAITYNPSIRPIGSKFPWETIAREFDVIAPMIYWNKRMNDPSLVYAESCQAIQSLKELIKDVNGRAKSIHPIGDSHHTSEKEIQAFVQACLKEDVVAESGISLYPSHLASSDLWRALSGVSEK